MKINFSKAIDAVLDQRDSVYLPKIGTIQLENLPSKILDDETAISPPSVILSHYNATTKNKALKKYLKKKYDISKEKADEAIKGFSDKLIKTIDKHGKVEIDKLMTIKKRGKKYQVKAKKSYLYRYYDQLPIVKLDKIKKKDRKSVSEEAKEVISVKPTPEKSAPTETTNKKAVDNIIEKGQKSASSGSDMKKVAATTAATGLVAKKAVVKQDKSPAIKTKVGASKNDIKKVVNPVEKKAITPPPAAKAIPPSTKATPPPAKATPPSTKATPPPPAKSNVTYMKPNLAFPATKAKTPTSSAPPASVAASTKSEPMSLNEKLKQQQQTVSNTKPTNTPATAPSRSISQSTLSAKDAKPIGKLEYTAVPPSDEGFGCLGPAMALLALLLLFALVYFGCNKLKKISKTQANKTATETNVSPSTDDNDNTASITKENDDAVIEEDNSSTTEERPSECIIITGSYSNYENVSRMEDLLARNGYQVYIAENGPYTRVGFTYDCSNVDLADYLNNIRRQIEPKAWYLVPELYVDYEY